MKKLVIILVILLIGCTSSQKIEKPVTQRWDTSGSRYPGIHDPSIFVDEVDGQKTYYIFGTHITQAKSTNLTNWEVPKRGNGYVSMDNNVIFGNTIENLSETFEWAGYNDADSKNGFNLWAPDVIYNEDYVWKDGTKGAYMYYYSASSTWRRSAIGFMVSTDIEGPYIYGGTVVYSGFTKEDSTDGSDRNTNYVNTHLDELIKEGKISGFNDKWSRKNGKEYNTDYAPNALDPTLMRDEDNVLWMVYGSWSGGIYLLEMNEETGFPIYPKEDGQTDDGRHIDRYFGIKLAGGFHQSGEGPYIVYNQEANAYYLYVTYGGLAAEGGYNMRVFKSDDITGPYVDTRGSRPLFTASDRNDNYGAKVMGNYQLDGMSHGYKSPGHNSAFVDDDGQMYLVFHTRFNGRGEEFELKIHEVLINQSGWPVVLPYAYNVDFKQAHTAHTKDSIVGTYEMVNHGTRTESNMLSNLNVTLNEDGSLSGDMSGTWFVEDQFITIRTEDATYEGVVTVQQINLTKEKMVISLIGDNNETIYGSKDFN